MNNDIFEDVSETKDLSGELVNNNGNKSNKNIIIIILSVIALLLVIIIICVIINNTTKKGNNDKDTKETVLIDSNNYDLFDTTELILDSTSLTMSDIDNISKLENLEKLDIKNAVIDDISFIKDLKKLNVIKINVSTKLTDYSVLKNLDNLFTLEIYGGIGKSADMSVFSDLDKVSTLYLTLINDRDVSFIKEMSGLSLLSVDCSVDLYNKINELVQNTKIRLEKHGSLLKVDTSISNEIEDGIINWSQYDFNNTEVISIKLNSKYNNIKTLQEELNKLSNYKNLKNLTISSDEQGKPYSVENFDFLKNLTKLDYLYINGLNANDISATFELSNLKTLVLSNGNMANSKFNLISKLTKLETLNLSMQNITDISVLSNLTNLKKLYLSGNNITSIESLKTLTKLEELYVGCNENLKNYNSLSSLENLTILMITPDSVDIKLFENLKKLKTLYLGISFEKIDELKTTYPSITIEQLSECV